MKILISHDAGLSAHYYERTSLARAFEASGHEVKFWITEGQSPFDCFDSFQPNLFIGQAYSLNDSIIQCIKENPDIHCYFKAGDWGNLPDTYDLSKYQILVASDKEKENIKQVVEACNNQVYVGAHYLESRAEDTHGHWRQLGCVPLHSRLAADLFEFTNSRYIKEYESDIGFLGSFWSYKGINFNKYLFQFLSPNVNYNVKIFGNGGWGVPQYAGAIENENQKNFFRSVKINLNVSEIHSQAYGVEHCERIYKVLLSKGFLISDWNDDIVKHVFANEEMVWAKSPEQMKALVDFYLGHLHEREPFIQRGYEKVLESETYFARVAYLMKNIFGEFEEKKILDSYDKVKKELSL